ncbi:MAG TPA: UDP-glucose/GDP-mannose dehydrogenase family protein [Phycisphaerae bacterium]|nr:UDP-glucose/GDP-mannose dehydrogenase family protein [Phycisphaerae bacterium]HRW52744.1 UDP-glucose/GDP-mannose dehydrogenase family protein [Phycisphaerae bacterium]
MKVCVVGTGYVGLVAGTCFADGGNHVICVDKDATKIEGLKRGDVPIYEPGLSEIITRNVKAGRLEFTTELEPAVRESLVCFIAVGTPQDEDGSADLSAVVAVAKAIGQAMDGYRIVVTKSTVPVGTHKKVDAAIREVTQHPVDVVSNPEFMKEGAAVDDFTKPDRVVIGTTNPAVVEILKQLYAPFMRKSERLLVMDPASAEMTKYAANTLLATKVSFMNEVATLCEKFGADVEVVRKGVGSDSRIGHPFLFPGVGYGGSCFPKDVSAFVCMGREVGVPAVVAEAVQERNRLQRQGFAQRLLDYFGDRIRQTTIGVWGLAFKGRTDDVREAPAIDAIRILRDAGATIRAHDPEAMANGERMLGRERITYHADGYEALKDADVMVVFTDWPEFRTPDFALVRQALKAPVIFDGRNLYDPAYLAKQGFEYHSVGRPTVKPQ